MQKLTDKQTKLFKDFQMSGPVHLEKADLTRPFVYDRLLGVFYTNGRSCHSAAALLLSIKLNIEFEEVATKLHLTQPLSASNYWLLNTYGGAIRANPKGKVTVGSVRGMTSLEKILFKDFEGIED